MCEQIRQQAPVSKMGFYRFEFIIAQTHGGVNEIDSILRTPVDPDEKILHLQKQTEDLENGCTRIRVSKQLSVPEAVPCDGICRPCSAVLREFPLLQRCHLSEPRFCLRLQRYACDVRS